MDTTGIVLVIVGSIVFLAGIGLVLYFTVFRNMKTAKLVRETIKKYESSHSLLFGDINKYIKRLEHIATMNLSYSEEASSYKHRFSDLRDMSDQTAGNAADQLEGLLDDRHYKEINSEFDNYNNIITDYVTRVESLYSSLKGKFQEEEDTNAVLSDLGGRSRSLKQTYFSHQSELALLAPSFEAVFNNIDACFDEASTNIETANYARANRILRTTVDPIISELTRLIVNLPSMCLSAQSILPDHLSSLKYRYEEMSSFGYPLQDIIVPQAFDAFDKRIRSIVERLKRFEIDGLQDEIDQMTASFDNCSRLLDKEEKAFQVFTSEHDDIYKNQEVMENRWVNLCHAIPDVKKIFAFSEDDLKMIEDIRMKIDVSSATKRSLDTFEHSSNRQPYTVLVEKMSELRNQTNECLTYIDAFQDRLVKMKDDIESANKDLPIYWTKVRIAEASIRGIKINKVSDKYIESIDTIFSLIDSLYHKISFTPIDVKSVNITHDELKAKASEFLSKVEAEENKMREAEEAIVFRNRYRDNSNSQSLRQAEALLLEGEFTPALEIASSVNDPLEQADSEL